VLSNAQYHTDRRPIALESTRQKQRELSFWKTHHKSIKAHLTVAATVSIGHHASLCVVWYMWSHRCGHGRDRRKICEQATQHDNVHRTQQQPSSHNTATRERRQSPDTFFTVTIYNTVTDGFSGQPINNRQCLRRPTSTSPRLNSITSYTNHFTDTRHATISATQYYRSTDSLIHCHPLVSKEW
jgi:hypothetical protein